MSTNPRRRSRNMPTEQQPGDICGACGAPRPPQPNSSLLSSIQAVEHTPCPNPQNPYLGHIPQGSLSRAVQQENPSPHYDGYHYTNTPLSRATGPMPRYTGIPDYPPYGNAPSAFQFYPDYNPSLGVNVPLQTGPSCAQSTAMGTEVQPTQQEALEPSGFSREGQNPSYPITARTGNGQLALPHYTTQIGVQPASFASNPGMDTPFAYPLEQGLPSSSLEYPYATNLEYMPSQTGSDGLDPSAYPENQDISPRNGSTADSAGSYLPYHCFNPYPSGNLQANQFQGLPNSSVLVSQDCESHAGYPGFTNDVVNVQRTRDYLSGDVGSQIPPSDGASLAALFGSSTGVSQASSQNIFHSSGNPSASKRGRTGPMSNEGKEHAKDVRSKGACKICREHKVKCTHVLAEDRNRKRPALTYRETRPKSRRSRQVGEGQDPDNTPQEDVSGVGPTAFEGERKDLLTRDFQEAPKLHTEPRDIRPDRRS